MNLNFKLNKFIEKNMSDKTLQTYAKELGIPNTNLNDWKNGRLPNAKSLVHILKIAKYFNVTLEEVLFGINLNGTESCTLSTTHFSDSNSIYRIKIEKLEKLEKMEKIEQEEITKQTKRVQENTNNY